MTVSEDFEVEENVTVKTIPEGLYVTKSCLGISELGKVWKDLSIWVRDSKEYKYGEHQCLEENTNPKILEESKIPFILYFPIAK
jgi:hypothetical protein